MFDPPEEACPGSDHTYFQSTEILTMGATPLAEVEDLLRCGVHMWSVMLEAIGWDSHGAFLLVRFLGILK